MRGWAAVFACLAVACSVPAPPAGRFADQDVVVAGNGSDATADSGTKEGTGSLHVDGTWAFLNVTSDCEFVLGKAFEVLSYSVGLDKFQSTDGYAFKQVLTTCTMKETPLLGQASIYSQDMIDSLNPHTVYALVNGHEAGAVYIQAPDPSLWGLVMKDPFTDPIPTKKTDSRIRDTDHDGHPGVTIHVGNLCDVYLVQRSVTRSKGTVESAISIRASNIAHADVFRIGATKDICMSQNVDVPMPAYSYLVLKRVDGHDGSPDLDDNRDGRIDCAEIMAHWQDIFTMPRKDDKHCKDISAH